MQKPQYLTPSLNFRVFFTAYNQRKLGNITSFLLVSISHLQINIFLFQSCMRLFPSDNLFIICLNAPTQYLYTTNFLSISQPIYITIRSFAWALPTIFLISFLAFRYKLSHQKKSKSLENLFTLLSTYFPMILFLPILEILSKDFFCQQSVLSTFNYQCFQSQHRIIVIISLLCAILAILMSGLTIFYSQSGVYDKKNYLSGNNRGYEALLIIIKLVLTLIITQDDESEGFGRYYAAINLGLSLILTCYFLLILPYHKLPIEKASLVWIGFYLSQSIAIVITRATSDENFIVSLPFLMLLLVVVFGNLLLYNRIKAWNMMKERVFSSSDFLRKVQTLLQLNQIEEQDSPEEIYFHGVVARHISSCRQIDCFCKQKQLFDPKKSKIIEFEKWPTAKSLTMKHYLRLLFEQQLKKTPNDVDLLINYALFLFQKFRNIPLALIQLTNIINNNTYLYPSQRFKIFKLRSRISDFINSKNLEALEVSLQIENVIEIEEQFSNVIQGLSSIIQSSINFWGYLRQKDLDMDQIRSLSEQLCQSVDLVSSLWTPLKPYLHKYKKLMYYYNWYLKEFLSKKTILSEEGIDDLFEEDRYSVRSDDFLNNLKDDHLLFDGQTPIIHMSGNSHNTGQIIKVNKAVIKTFGYAKEELEKSNVNVLMPRLIGERHTSYITSFVKTGRTRALYKQRRTFAKNKAGFMMPIWILAKQINNLEGLVEYVGLIRPLSEKKEDPTEYILFNNFGEVGGLSKNIAKIFACTNIRNIQKLPFNIVLLAPKLIKYLYFKDFLVENSKEIESKREIEENRLQGKIETSPKSPIRSTASPTLCRGKLKTILPKLERAIPFLGSGTKMHDLQEFLELDENDEEESAEFLNEKMITFTMRLPEDLEGLLKEFEETRTRKRNSIIQRNKFVEVVNMTQMESIETQRDLLSFREIDRRVRGHFSSSKSTFDAYLAALKMMAVKIAKQTSSVQVFRVTAEICTDSYGADGDIIQYLKIKEVIRRTPASTTTLSPPPSSSSKKRFSKAVDSEALGLLSFREPFVEDSSPENSPTKRQARKSIFSKGNFSHMIPNLIFSLAIILPRKDVLDGGETVPNEAEGGFVSLEDYDGRSPQTTNRPILKSQEDEMESKSSVSSKGEGEDQSQKSGNSGKMALQNELKYNIMNQFQSVFHKEENGIIPKEFKNLNKLKWFFYFFFTLMTPLALAVYFLGLNKSLGLVSTSVSNIYSNEKLRRDFLKAADAMLTVAMYAAGRFNGITDITAAQLQGMIENKLDIITESYNDILVLSDQDEFIKILYEYVPRIQETKTISYGGSFSDTITTENLLQKLMNDLSAITSFNVIDFIRYNRQFLLFQKYGVDTFDRVLFDVSFNFFQDIDESFDSSHFLLIWFAIAICAAFLFGGIFVIRLILIVIQSLKQILISFTAIDLHTIKETEDYYQRLLYFFTASTSQFLYDQPQKSFFRDIEGAPLRPRKPKEKFQKKNRQIQENKFLKKETRIILSYFIIGLLLYAGLNLLFFLIAYTTIRNTTEVLHDAKELVKLDTTYTSALMGLKFLVVDPTATFYQQNVKNSLTNTLNSLEMTLSTEIITAESEFSDFVRGFLHGEVCQDFRFMEPDQAEECENFALGRLSTGLAPFHNYFSGLVLKVLQLQTKFSDVLNIDLVYEYGELIDIINEAFMERGFELWKEETQNEVIQHERTFIGLIVGLVVLNAGIFVLVGVKIIRLLQRRFLFFRRVYNKYMLTEALNKEKLIKAALVKHQLLNR